MAVKSPYHAQYDGEFAEKISDILFEQCVELLIDSGKNQSSITWNSYKEKKQYEKYRASLDEEILKKFGAESKRCQG